MGHFKFAINLLPFLIAWSDSASAPPGSWSPFWPPPTFSFAEFRYSIIASHVSSSAVTTHCKKKIKVDDFLYKFSFWSTCPESQPVVMIMFMHVVRPSVRQLLWKQAKLMDNCFGQAEWIIDDFGLNLFVIHNADPQLSSVIIIYHTLYPSVFTLFCSSKNHC